MLPPETTLTSVTATPPMVMDAPAVKFAPETATLVPPDAGPVAGAMPVSVGGLAPEGPEGLLLPPQAASRLRAITTDPTRTARPGPVWDNIQPSIVPTTAEAGKYRRG